jgi:glycosyltransferase involved in cell wall biosynthesis
MAAVLNFLKAPGLGKEMGRRGKQKVLAEYSWDRIVKIIEESFITHGYPS